MNTESTVCEEEKRTIQEVFQKQLFEFKQGMSSKKYRKVLEDIRNKEIHFYFLDNFWKMREAKLRCIIKIILRKIDNDGGNYKSTEYWMNKADKVLEDWQNKIDINLDNSDIDIKEELEVYIELLFLQLYNHAAVCKGERHIGDSAGFLSLGIKLISVMINENYKMNAKTLYIAQNFYYFTSSILIADKDFSTASNYVDIGLNLCLRELIKITGGKDFNFKPEDYTKQELYLLDKLLTNFMIGLYQKGVCNENLADILPAVNCYSQARWIADKFKDYFKSLEFGGFVKGVEERAKSYLSTVKTLKQILNDVNLKDERNNNKKEKSNMDIFGDKLNQFAGTREYIEKLKIPEIEEDENIINNKSKKVKQILSTVKMTFDLMSSNFKNIVEEIKTKKNVESSRSKK